MQHHGFVTGSLLENQVEKFRRVLSCGFVDTDTDIGDELAQRLGVDADLRNKLSKLIKAAQLSPTASRSVNVTSEFTGGTMTLFCMVEISGVVTRLQYGQLITGRDDGAEWMRRAMDLENFSQQLSELLALGAANPAMEIGTSLTFVSDKGASVA